MSTEPYPLILKPAYKDYLWGGNRIQEKYGKEHNLAKCAESWEVADRPEGSSIVINGPLRDSTLGEALSEMGTLLAGDGRAPSRFPLLVKIIDAAKRLSVQVHPHESNAAITGGEPKTEMWYVLDSAPGAFVYAGLRRRTSPEEFLQYLQEGKLEQLLARVPVKRGDAVYIPGGRIHAIAEGCLLLEIQQNSNTTYRVYDWDRKGEDGKARKLHVDPAMKTINWQDTGSALATPKQADIEGRNTFQEMVDCPYFRTERIGLKEKITVREDTGAYRILFASSAPVQLKWKEKLLLTPGTSCLIPAAITEYELAPQTGEAEIVGITGK